MGDTNKQALPKMSTPTPTPQQNNYTNFLLSHVLPAYELDGDQFLNALELSGGAVAGSAAVQCVLGSWSWLCGDIDIFVADEADADILGTFMGLMSYDEVWRGTADEDQYSSSFAAAVQALRIYQRWMPWNGVGPAPGAGTAYAGAERFGAKPQVRRAVKVFVGLDALVAMDIDCCATTFRVVGQQAMWDVMPDLLRRRCNISDECTTERRLKYESMGLDVHW